MTSTPSPDSLRSGRATSSPLKISNGCARCRRVPSISTNFPASSSSTARRSTTMFRSGLATLWTRDQLTPENLEWLRSLPQGPVHIDELPGIQFVHGSSLDEDEYTVSASDAIEPLITSPAPITFFGHTHLQGGFVLSGAVSEAYRPGYRTVGQPETSDWPLRKNRRYLINPGSVGQPRDGDWRAAFAVFDSDSWIVTFHRVPYDLRIAQEKIIAAKLPQRLATRLATGR